MTPEQEQLVIQHAASGIPQGVTADMIGVQRPAICKQQKKHREQIESLQAMLAEQAYQPAIDNIVGAIRDYSTLQGSETEHIQRREHGYKASVKVAEAMGILPSHSQSIFVQNIFNQVNNISSPVVDALLSHAGVIDVDYMDVDDD